MSQMVFQKRQKQQRMFAAVLKSNRNMFRLTGQQQRAAFKCEAWNLPHASRGKQGSGQ